MAYDAVLRGGDQGRGEDDEARMRRFIGRNWPDFEDVWRRMRKDGALATSFSGPAFSFSIAWLFYRRLYVEAALAIAVEIAITRLSPLSSTLIDLLLCLAIGAFGKALVVRKGLRTLDVVSRQRLPHGEATAQIERRGGVRLAEALAASILFVGFSAASVFRMISAGVTEDGTIQLDGLQELIKAL